LAERFLLGRVTWQRTFPAFCICLLFSLVPSLSSLKKTTTISYTWGVKIKEVNNSPLSINKKNVYLSGPDSDPPGTVIIWSQESGSRSVIIYFGSRSTSASSPFSSKTENYLLTIYYKVVKFIIITHAIPENLFLKSRISTYFCLHIN